LNLTREMTPTKKLGHNDNGGNDGGGKGGNREKIDAQQWSSFCGGHWPEKGCRKKTALQHREVDVYLPDGDNLSWKNLQTSCVKKLGKKKKKKKNAVRDSVQAYKGRGFQETYETRRQKKRKKTKKIRGH